MRLHTVNTEFFGSYFYSDRTTISTRTRIHCGLKIIDTKKNEILTVQAISSQNFNLKNQLKCLDEIICVVETESGTKIMTIDTMETNSVVSEETL